ncbi:glycosyltransferase [Hyalangium versicolor]|uniref:glycosyltransferase n=1 Tax=Hyalangium versicolor TaxID=2861190 RepID=UPI001CCDC248|nr:glycosyltransferase [Hyalangium versicolor]
MEFSVIVVTHNALEFTVRCVESLRRNLPEQAEIIFVDNASTDGTRAYLKEITERMGSVAQLLLLDRNEGWCRGINAGLERARGKYLVLLNSDVVVTPEWLTGLRECMEQAGTVVPGLRRVGLVGPVTNSAGGPQQVANPPPFHSATLDTHARRHRDAFRRNWGASFFLSGFCLMLHRDCYAEIGGLDERFSPGGFDDNDLVLRAQERGWDCVIAGDVYIHHEGSATFRRVAPEMRSGLANRGRFYEKWRELRRAEPRLIAAYRVKNAEATLRESLEATARFADGIVVLDDGSSDGTRALCEHHPAVLRYEYQDLPFHERRDRNRVLTMAAEQGADWIISIDSDEVFEMDRARAQRLMRLTDPHVKVLGFHWYTFWEPSHTYFRADGIFGNMSGYRMYRCEPGQRIVLGTENGLHCGNIPQFPAGAARYTDIRVRHLGYDTEPLRRAKHSRYRQLDPSPRPDLVGNSDYSHLLSSTVTLRRYPKEHGVSLCVIARNEEERLEGFLAGLEPFVDEICVVDNGSTDRTQEIARRFTDKVVEFRTDRLDLDRLRNRCLDLATQPWILVMDPDEELALQDLPRLQRLMDDLDVHAYTFQVSNHQKEGAPVMTLAARLFRNDSRIRFSRPVHETVERSLASHPELVVRPSNVPLQHYGFLKEDQAVEGKLQRYYERNREYREAHPDDAMAWYNEALHLQNEGRELEAARFLERAVELDPSFLSPRSQLALIHQELAVRLWSALAERTSPEHPVHRVARDAIEMLYRITPGRTPIGKAREELLR